MVDTDHSLLDIIGLQSIAFISQHLGLSNTPDRIAIKTNNNDITLFKPSQFGHSLGLKIAAVRSNNPIQYNLSTVQASIILNNIYTGAIQCIINATYLTAVRTAAGSALATNIFANKHSTRLVLYGSGLQAKLHIQCVLLVRPMIQYITIINRTRSNAAKLIDELKLQYNHHNIVYNAIEWSYNLQLDENIDIICTTTNASTPVLHSGMLNQVDHHQLHINAIGSYTPDMIELHDNIVSQCSVIIDTDSAKLCGDIAQCSNNNIVQGELGEYARLNADTLDRTIDCGIDDHVLQQCIQHRAKSIRPSPTNMTLFKSVGTAVQDMSAAYYCYNNALKHNIGTYISI